MLRNADPRDEVPMPPLFDRAIPDPPRRWDLRTDPPNAVVVNLGANDFAAGTPERTAFVGAYRRLLDRIREHRPDVPVLLVLSPMIWDDATHTSRRDARAWLEALLAERRAAGETRMEIVDQWADASEGVGCQVHPNVRTHRRLGRELADVLRARLGW